MTTLAYHLAQVRGVDVRSFDPDLHAAPTTNPNDPRNDDEDPTSEQTVGELPCTVTYRLIDGRVALQEVTVEGPDKVYALDSDDFAEHIKAQWKARIQREVKDALEDAHRNTQARRFA